MREWPPKAVAPYCRDDVHAAVVASRPKPLPYPRAVYLDPLGMPPRRGTPASTIPMSAAKHGFPRSARLLHREDYEFVFKNARVRVSNSAGTLLVVENGRETSRIGVIVAKKIIKRAVDRNRVKRAAREHYRQHALDRSCDIVFLARSGANTQTDPPLQDQIAALWYKLRLKLSS